MAPTRDPRPRAPVADGPDVILDFVFDQGLLHATLRNVSARPAARVSVHFQRKFRGLGGRVSIPDLPLFKDLTLLAPWKEIGTLVDTSQAYFSRGEPTHITAWVTFHDLDGKAFRRRVDHDLSIYQGLAYVTRGAEGRPPSPGVDRSRSG